MSLNCLIGSRGDCRHFYLLFGHPQCCSCLTKETHESEGLHHGWRQQGHAAVKTSFKSSNGLLIIAKSNPCRRENKDYKRKKL